MNGRIETLEELQDVFDHKQFSSYTVRSFAGLVWGVVERLRDSGVSQKKIDEVLVEAGVKSPGNVRRYIERGKRLNPDRFAFERHLGMDPDAWHPGKVPGLKADMRTPSADGKFQTPEMVIQSKLPASREKAAMAGHRQGAGGAGMAKEAAKGHTSGGVGPRAEPEEAGVYPGEGLGEGMSFPGVEEEPDAVPAVLSDDAPVIPEEPDIQVPDMADEIMRQTPERDVDAAPEPGIKLRKALKASEIKKGGRGDVAGSVRQRAQGEDKRVPSRTGFDPYLDGKLRGIPGRDGGNGGDD